MTDEEARRYLAIRDERFGPNIVSPETEFLKMLYERVVALESRTSPPPVRIESVKTLVFILNGEDRKYVVKPGMPMRHARNDVLELTGNTGRPPDEWEIRDVFGNFISPDAMAFSFADEQRFFCTIRVGAGG